MLEKFKTGCVTLLMVGFVASLGAAGYFGWSLYTTNRYASSAMLTNKAIAEMATRAIVWRVAITNFSWKEDKFLDVVYTIKVGYDFEEISKSRAVDEDNKIIRYTLPTPMIISIDDKFGRNSLERKSLYARLFSSENNPQREQDLMELQLLAQDCERYNLFALDLLTEKLKFVLELLNPGYQIKLISNDTPNAVEMFKRYVQAKSFGAVSLPNITPTTETPKP